MSSLDSYPHAKQFTVKKDAGTLTYLQPPMDMRLSLVESLGLCGHSSRSGRRQLILLALLVELRVEQAAVLQ
jgi:hypothetical protein